MSKPTVGPPASSALTGAIQNSGLVEVPLGMALRGLIGNIGGGCQSGRAFTAVQLGGPSGGCLPPDLLATCIDYDAIARVTPISGGIRHARLAGQGLVWLCPSADHSGTPIPHTQTFTRGRVRFHAIAAPGPAEELDATFPLILTTGRILCQYHTGTMTRRSEDLTWRASRGYAEIHEQDAATAWVVRYSSRAGEVKSGRKPGSASGCRRAPCFCPSTGRRPPPTCSRTILPWTRWQRFPSTRSVPCVLNVHGWGRTARRSASQHFAAPLVVDADSAGAEASRGSGRVRDATHLGSRSSSGSRRQVLCDTRLRALR
jgi:hypothetical protein